MGLSKAELELQSADYLPAREVMSSLGGGHGHGDCFFFQDGAVNTNVNVSDIEVAVLKDINIFTGNDSDVVDIDDSFLGIL